MNNKSLKQKGLTPTHCAVLYLRYCLQHLPYNSDAFAEVADVAPLNNAQYKAVQKALQSKLASFIKKLDASLGKKAPSHVEPEQGEAKAKLEDGLHTI
jgi:hypothetical protein